MQAENLKADLPGGAAASHGPIRRAVYNEVVSLCVRTLTVCIPGHLTSVLHEELLYSEGLGDAAWMTSTDEVHGLILSSLRLTEKHFPQIDEPERKDEQSNSQECNTQGNGQWQICVHTSW